jgi:hypothetical protein
VDAERSPGEINRELQERIERVLAGR